jgi:glutamate 5-kinase
MNGLYDKIVIKVGTNTLTDDLGAIDVGYMSELAEQIAQLRVHGAHVLLVTSGAIRAGIDKMGLTERPKTIPEKQAAAAVGQSVLMQLYSEAFRRFGITTGQVLLTREDFKDRTRYLNARNTLLTLCRHGIVPIINENDTIAIEEIRVGDNDNLAALVASNLEADLLILLSDVPGLYDGNPGESSDARLIPVVTAIDEHIRRIAGGAGSSSGTGGMRTKIQAAEIAMNSGVTMAIADGRRRNVITDIAAGEQLGTFFLPRTKRLRGRKRWIAFGARPSGSISVNDGARKMIRECGKSILPAGIIGIAGDFSAGDMVRVTDKDGNPFARGFVNYSADEIEKIRGKHSSEIEEILGHKDFDEVIHRDNLVVRK